jgi:hypothetical protein
VVFEAFKTHRLVAIGETETFATLQNHYDVLALLLTDPRLPLMVDDILVGFGNALYQDTVDRFVAGQPVDDADLRLAWRNTTQSPVETWDAPVFEQFYRTVRAVNWALPAGKKMRLVLGDPPVDWSKVTTLKELLVFAGPQRDEFPASVVEKQVLDKGHRALICYGWWHLLHSSPHNLVGLVEQRTGERTYTIADLVPLAGDPGGMASRLARYPRNTVIPTAGSWLGSFDAGLMPPSGQGGPNGNGVNPWCGIRLGSLIDAGIYEGQPEDLTASWPNPAIYLDPVYWKELQRRNALQGNGLDLNSYRQEKPASHLPLKLPSSEECGKAAD